MLTPEQRTLRARIAAYERHSRGSGVEATEKARAASPGGTAYWLNQVDPGNQLPESERHRRAEAAKRAHFSRLALKSCQARAARKATA